MLRFQSHYLILLKSVSEQTLNSNLFPIADFADIQCPEVLNKVREGHPEESIITELRFNLIDGLLSPIFAVTIRPITFPFKRAPWIPHVQKLMTLELNSSDNGIGMARDKAHIFCIISLHQ
jgi:hypothetical protein